MGAYSLDIHIFLCACVCELTFTDTCTLRIAGETKMSSFSLKVDDVDDVDAEWGGVTAYLRQAAAEF